METNNPLFGLISTIVILLSICGCIQENSVTNSDFEISSFKWENCANPGDKDCDYAPIYYDKGELVGYGNLIVTSSKDFLRTKIYVNGNDLPQTDSPGYLKKGENKIFLIAFKKISINQPVTVKVCISTQGDFTQYSNNVICKEKSFSYPRVSFSISNVPITFSLNKDSYYEEAGKIDETGQKGIGKIITVKNTGEIPINIDTYVPSSNEGIETAPQYRVQLIESPRYPDGNLVPALTPGQSAKYKIQVSILPDSETANNQGTPTGTYTVTGNVVSSPYLSRDSATFKQEFTIVTTVELQKGKIVSDENTNEWADLSENMLQVKNVNLRCNSKEDCLQQLSSLTDTPEADISAHLEIMCSNSKCYGKKIG
jgi:hypothetical protein